MGIIDTIVRSTDDLLKPKKKSYWGYKLDIDLVDVEKIQNKVRLLPAEERAVAHELSGKEPIEHVIVLSNSLQKLGRFTTLQIKELFDDMGFNVDTIVSELHHSDIAAVMNVNGFVIPGWEAFAQFVARIFPSWEKLLLTKLAPGRERLHIRLFEMNDGSWLIAAHTDWNWMSFNLLKVFHAHATVGAGDYEMGTRMLFELLHMFRKRLEANTVMTYQDIVGVTRGVYYQILADRVMKPLRRR